MESLNASLPHEHEPEHILAVDGGNSVCYGEWLGVYCPNFASLNVSFPFQPSITKVCRQIRQENVPIFYGANVYIFHDCYEFHEDSDEFEYFGIHTPFPAMLLQWLDCNRGHIPWIAGMHIESDYFSAQENYETICALTDLDFPFKDDALQAIEPQMRKTAQW